MDVKKVALLVGALVIAVITAVMAKNMFTGAGAQQARRARGSGGAQGAGRQEGACRSARSSSRQLAFQPWPKELMQNAYYSRASRTAIPRS